MSTNKALYNMIVRLGFYKKESIQYQLIQNAMLQIIDRN